MPMTKFLYVIHAPDVGRVKIGSSVNPQDRLKTLQAASPVELILVGCMRGTAQDVKEIQERFVAIRILGDWFDDSILNKLNFDAPPAAYRKSTKNGTDGPRQEAKRQKLIERAQFWFEKYGYPPRAGDWKNVRGTPWPSYQTCIRAFGSWDDFVLEAGFDPRGRGQPI